MGSLRILMIPSWYPTSKDKVSGNFFKEQARLLNQENEVVVLYFERKSINLSAWIFLFLTRKIFDEFNLDNNSPKTIIYSLYEIVVPLKFKKNYFLRVLFSKLNSWIFFKTVNKADVVISGIIRPQLLHVQSLFGTGVSACIFKKKYGWPIVITEHQVYKQTLVPDHLNKYFNLSIKFTDHVICVSTHLLRVMVSYNYISKFSIIGNPVNEEIFTIQQENESFTPKLKEFVSITYDNYIKDTMTLLRALNYCINKGYTNLKLVLIINTFGEKETIPDHWYQFLAANNLLQYIEPYYNLSRNEVAEMIKRKDVYISTSLAETFGLAIAESLMSGLYILSSKNGGSDDFLDDTNSRRFNIGDYEMLGEFMIRIIENEISWEPINQRNSILKQIGQNNYKKKMNEVYRSVLKSQKATNL